MTLGKAKNIRSSMPAASAAACGAFSLRHVNAHLMFDILVAHNGLI